MTDTKIITTSIEITGLDENRRYVYDIVNVIEAAAAQIKSLPRPTSECTVGVCLGDMWSITMQPATVRLINDSLRAPIVSALVSLADASATAATAAVHGWKDANDLLLDASEQAFADRTS